MKLEQEAAAYTKGKQTQFIEALSDYLEPLELFIRDNLHHSTERDTTLSRLQESILWASHCSSVHGVK